MFKNIGKGIKKLIWQAGDTLKGKTKVGKVLDGVLEVLPVPNPIRIVRDVTTQGKLRQLADNPEVVAAADAAGVDLGDLLDDAPSWVQPTLAALTIIGVLVLIGLDMVDPMLLVEIVKAIFAG